MWNVPDITFKYKQEHIERFSNLHQYTFWGLLEERTEAATGGIL